MHLPIHQRYFPSIFPDHHVLSSVAFWRRGSDAIVYKTRSALCLCFRFVPCLFLLFDFVFYSGFVQHRVTTVSCRSALYLCFQFSCQFSQGSSSVKACRSVSHSVAGLLPLPSHPATVGFQFVYLCICVLVICVFV